MRHDSPALRLIRMDREIRRIEEQQERAEAAQDCDAASKHRDEIQRLKAERERFVLEVRSG